MSQESVSYLILDFSKKTETQQCLESIKKHSKFAHKIIYLDNGSNQDYPWEFYKEGLCDVLISKHKGMGGGYGQTDLFRFCDTTYAFLVQNDQVLARDITDQDINYFVRLLHGGSYQCVDLNGDQSGRGVWTDRAHFINTAFFNSLGPFPNGGPGLDYMPWNEEYLQKIFQKNNYKIAHISPAPFLDNGKWSVREAGDGIYKHRCDTKELYVIKKPTYRTEIYPPLNDLEWGAVLEGKWVDGTIPEKWKAHSFRHWKD